MRCTHDTERGSCIQEEIVVIDDDDDDMVVEATVRSIQMAEDEAFARSLQEQFDREEQFNQEQNRLQTTSPNRPPRNLPALLALEEIQGSVMGKKTLTKVEIERLPAKAYDPAHSAGKTECQICFSDYKKGEKLRMLPCFHDYHVKCIDRWLKVL
ncbi:hypothetical protein C0J45_5051 [Silurus meridionalis]|nr:hypothetical protein C0J45_5051 [Silurus meridionalis]